MNLQELSDEELSTLRIEVLTEQERRAIVATAAEQIAALQDAYERATSIPVWVQPTGAHDAYKKDDRVSHNGNTWTSTVAANVWEPGVYGWTKN